jgi:hypothetical protein
METLFNNDMKGVSGGILIVDKINNNNIIILGKPNISKRENEYESFGGKKEEEDLTSLHTAIREFIEEFFNMRISTDHINIMATYVRTEKIIVKQREFYGMSYMINMSGLNKIFQKLCNLVGDSNILIKYNVNNKFDLNKYIDERTVDVCNGDGMNEIKSLHIFNIADIKEQKIKLRWYTKKIIAKMV